MPFDCSRQTMPHLLLSSGHPLLRGLLRRTRGSMWQATLAPPHSEGFLGAGLPRPPSGEAGASTRLLPTAATAPASASTGACSACSSYESESQ